MTTTAKFAHDDIVKVISTGQQGTVKGSRHEEEKFIYRLLLGGDAAEEIDATENDLKLVKMANEDETGLSAIRYIS